MLQTLHAHTAVLKTLAEVETLTCLLCSNFVIDLNIMRNKWSVMVVHTFIIKLLYCVDTSLRGAFKKKTYSAS